MHVESVAWISERKDVLYTFFFLSGLITYIKYLNVTDNNNKKFIWLAATFALFVISCLSKAMAVVFPLVLLLIKFWQYQPTGNNQVKESIKETISLKNIIPLIPFFVTSLIFGIVAISINKLNTFTILHRIQFATYGFLMYIVKFFFPGNQLAIYPYPSQAEYDTATIGLLLKLAPFAFILLSVLIAYSLRKTKLFVFGMGFFLVTIIMVLQLISVGVAIMADRYTYLPYIGLAFIPAMLIGDKVMLKRIPIFVFTCVFIIVMIFLARRQTSVWRNSETLWSKVIDKYPAMETARSIRGIYWEKKAEKAPNAQTQNYFEDKAFEDFKIAIKAGTPRADVYEGAGCIYGKWGDLNNALFCFNNAIRLKPQKGSAYFNRALTLSKLNNNEGAIKDYNLALVYQPQRALQILTNRYILFLSTGKFKEATQDLDYLISVDGNNFIFYYNRAQARTQLNDIQGAISDYKKVLTLQPNDQMSKTELQKILKK
jgi:Flp pilus assembly protein TadD